MSYYNCRPLESGRRRTEWVPLNDLDKKDGFCSSFNGNQVLETLNRYFVVERIH